VKPIMNITMLITIRFNGTNSNTNKPSGVIAEATKTTALLPL